MDGLKEENVRLKSKINELELEKKRNGCQVDRMEEKHDRQDTSAWRRNLIFEGIPESNGPNKILQPVIYKLMDQMGHMAQHSGSGPTQRTDQDQF